MNYTKSIFVYKQDKTSLKKSKNEFEDKLRNRFGSKLRNELRKEFKDIACTTQSLRENVRPFSGAHMRG